ncbi:hypothetical protein RCO28_06240 [Streptomyces sp. LHD-70]|uniref:hypothetical protein n=1 Tax=Streptomyces sp. LHD-70 TaxID=3072140 RepID=UPI00280CEA4D|nr:hypothetical protein [Streptomyces sp. LHD-70]MDQ8702092.1 hypothetical protein [Streptomyces sp. LHD-70]
MQSNDARTLVPIVVPTVAAGAIAAVVSGIVAGGEGAIGAVVATAVVCLFMGLGILGLQFAAKHFPHLFQAMGLVLYVVQLLVLFAFVAVFKDTTLFNPKTFAATIIVAAVVWVAAQARAHLKAKIFYVDPDSSDATKNDKSGSSS